MGKKNCSQIVILLKKEKSILLENLLSPFELGWKQIAHIWQIHSDFWHQVSKSLPITHKAFKLYIYIYMAIISILIKSYEFYENLWFLWKIENFNEELWFLWEVTTLRRVTTFMKSCNFYENLWHFRRIATFSNSCSISDMTHFL